MYDAGAFRRVRQAPIRGRIWQRRRLQLGGGVLVAVLFPSAIAATIEPGLWQFALFPASILGSLVATCLGFWLFSNMVAFPGIRASYYVLPVFASTFGAVFAVFFLLRLDYSRPLLITGFLLSVTWYYVVYFMIQRQQRLSIAVVPMGGVDSLYPIDSISWTQLDHPVFPRHCTTLTADFDYDLPPEWERFLAECALAGISVVHYKQLRQSLTGQVQMERLSENAFGSLMPNATYLTVKQLADAAIALALFPLVLPVLLVIAAGVKADSPGPILFRQNRIGYRGRVFTVWKFRTMHVAQPPCVRPEDGAITAPGDPRITRFGRHLRRTRIDEIPQIYNILRGEMSWIGPRPEAEILSQWYEREIPFYRYRHIVRPGVSGWAQVNQGHVAGIDDVLKKLSYDFFYISRFSFWLDMLIVVRTLKTIVTGFGSR